MTETTTDRLCRPPELHDDHDAGLDADVLWVPPEQPPKRGVFAVHAGELVLAVTCDDCGKTTRTTPHEHLFVPCAHCPGEITLTWEPSDG